MQRSANRRTTYGTVLLSGLFLWMAGCTGPTYNPPPGSDTSASNLDVEMLVDQTGQQLSATNSNDSLSVAIYFTLNGQNGIEFNQGETVTCGGTALAFSLGRYTTTLSGWTDPLLCTYTRNGSATSMSVALARLPRPTYPVVGSTVPRSSALNVTYTPDPSSLGIRVRTDANRAPDSAFKPETGTLVYDATQEKQGVGTLTLERRRKANPGSSGFKSLSTVSTSDATVLITWA